MSSNVSYTTIVIAVVLSVALSTATIMTVPQVQDALRGPQGEPGQQGEVGAPGAQGLQGVKGDTGDIGPVGSSGFGELIYDSGWFALSPSYMKTLIKLDPRAVFVYMIGRESGTGIHQMYYGGVRYNEDETTIKMGAYWRLSDDRDLWIFRNPDDESWDEIRVLVWELPS